MPEIDINTVVDGRYAIKREIARGGMSTVCEARHLFSDAKVALKLLQYPTVRRPVAQARMIAEARVLGALRHPNIVALYDAGQCETHGPYLAMEMIPGRSLESLLVARRRLLLGQAVALMAQLCSALDLAHRRKILHRDIKPANLLIMPQRMGDQLKVIDFGVARATDITAPENKLTKAGELLGTLAYMAPEQLGGSDIDLRADVYSATAVLYECLTGDVAYPADNHLMMLANQLKGVRPRPLRDHGLEVSPAFEQIIQRGLSPNPDDRYRSAGDLSKALLVALGSPLPTLELLDRASDLVGASYLKYEVSSEPSSRQIPPPPPIGRRQYARAPYVTPVRILFANQTCDGRTADISEGGMMVVADQACEEGENVKVRLPLPTTGKVAVLEARAQWAKTSRGQRAIGLQFFEIPEHARQEIRTYVEFMTERIDAPN